MRLFASAACLSAELPRRGSVPAWACAQTRAHARLRLFACPPARRRSLSLSRALLAPLTLQMRMACPLSRCTLTGIQRARISPNLLIASRRLAASRHTRATRARVARGCLRRTRAPGGGWRTDRQLTRTSEQALRLQQLSPGVFLHGCVRACVSLCARAGGRKRERRRKLGREERGESKQETERRGGVGGG